MLTKIMFDILKENMVQERKWNLEITQLLKDQIDYLKNDIIHKNTIIESLIIIRRTSPTFVHSTPSSSSDVNDNNNNRNTSVNVEDSLEPASTNRYQVLVNDADADFDNEFENYVNIQVVKTKHPLNYNPEYNRSTPYGNRHPENDVLKYNHPKSVAKLEAYRFSYPSLAFIDSYLSNRKLRTKVNNSFS